MWNAIKLLLSSRKFVVALLGIASMVAAKFGLHWSTEAMAVVVLPLLAVILGIAYEDGKEKSAPVVDDPDAPL
jgi:hypothetical protein